ncbi:cytochrome P450 302a1, mitochondrial-like [Macrosteles quadrilineatus]|uniref:cytochrome P450 302a1, mitochondrial-like n=1 Tax=Macrosteles quadrilineatus TaxID=74068 RepID=UPI0023E2831B|nr:cytochrome P450 302a1, mitochondrial-like [Macrosteles quadrilineatus]
MKVFKKYAGSTARKYLAKRNLSCPIRADVQETKTGAKPFNSIPGPKSLPLVGTLWNYVPLLGEYRFDHLHVNGLRKLRKYGPLVREDIVPGVSVVWVYTPEDIETVYRCEGRYPERRSHLALQKYRRDRPHIYNSGGLLPTNGEEWWKLRSVFQRCLSRVQDVRSHLPVTDTIMTEFTKYAAKNSIPTTDFLPKLSRLHLELTCMTAFSTRLQSFSDPEQLSQSRSSQLISAAATTNSCILRTDNGPQLWRWVRTPLYRKLEQALHTLELTAVALVNKVQQEREGGKAGSSLVAQYLAAADLNIRDIYGMAVDLILAGIDTTTYTSCFALYHLATHPQVQTQLYEEACRLLPSSTDAITSTSLTQAVVCRAVVKETLRLNPVSVGVGRILAKDAVLSGYNVPAGTVVVTQNQVTCRLDEYFPQPNDFIPARWMKGTPEYRTCSPYLVLPFGHGPRACIARRLAEQALQVLLLRMVREYELNWEGGKLDVRSLLINKPDGPVLLRLKNRS